MSVKTTEVNAKSIEEAFEQSGLSFIAESAEMINSANGKTIDGKKVVYRSDTGTQLGIVGTNYGIIQNNHQFSFMNTLCSMHDITINKVREYNGGSLINLQAEFKDRSLAVNKGDEIGFHLDTWNSFDGSANATASFFALRLVCLNGLVRADSNAMESISVKHTKNAVVRYEEAIKVFAGFEVWYESFKNNVEVLNRKMVDTRMVNNFLDNLLGESSSTKMKNKKAEIENLFVAGKGNHGKTAWDILNASVEYIDHFSKKTEEERIEYATVGGGYDLKAKAFDLAMNLN